MRAINVAGHAIVKMDELSSAFVSAGCKDVKTVIQSGNVLFGSAGRDPSAVVEKVKRTLHKSLGSEVTMMIRRLSEIERLVETDPFKDFEADSDAKFYVAFLSERPRRKPSLPLLSDKEALEAFAIQDREAFIVSRRKANGFYGFPNNFIESELGVQATSRNWSTIGRIVALS
ncbi:MAG: DUF1697 domain-containing protein [Verrucomicrobia bacterium]|nr:DUF1697 domain-containing protein [Verrucomicrobiota bacterium]